MILHLGCEIFSSAETYGRQRMVAKVIINDSGTLNEAKRLKTFVLYMLHLQIFVT